MTIDRRFRGPPESGNGGYCCGILGRHLAGAAVVTLFAPPPLDHPLTVCERDGTLYLCDGERDIGAATAEPLDLDVPPAPSPEESAAASAGYTGFDTHPFPGCFVCGTERRAGDGLRLYPGPTADGGCVAAPWTPDASLAGEDGRVAPEFVWAALDCPSYFGLQRPGLVALLGRMHAEIVARPGAGEPCVVSAWPIDRDGRKYRAGSAIFDSTGALLARSAALWIELKSG